MTGAESLRYHIGSGFAQIQAPGRGRGPSDAPPAVGQAAPPGVHPSPSHDRQRLARLTPGSDSDFDVLYRLAYDTVVRTCLVVLGGDPAAAQDCAQDTFVRAYRAWPRWRPEAPVEVWLHRIAVNVARSHRRRRMFRELPLLFDGLWARAQPLDDTDRKSVV